MKVYRDWQISGDRAWLQRMYGPAKKSLDYCIEVWDPKHQGVLVEPHHNTYDIEFWGADGMCSSLYVAALSAIGQLARDAGREADAPFYEKLAAKGARLMDTRLFNGEYFQQKIQYRGLRDTSFADFVDGVNKDSSEGDRLMKKEGPKYQFGTGCLSDGVIGAWMARIYGIPTPLTPKHIRRHLQSVFMYNFRHDLWEHANPQRPGYALGHEPGLLLCTWPKGGKRTLPFPYSDEVWTGVEYQVASHLIEEGMLDEGLTIVQAVRTRYDGQTRNPWNEYECGSYYARAMSSYALLGSLSGLKYSAVSKVLRFAPKLRIDKFRIFFSAASGFGTVTLAKDKLTVEVVEGQLEIASLELSVAGRSRTIEWNTIALPGQPAILKCLRQ